LIEYGLLQGEIDGTFYHCPKHKSGSFGTIWLKG